MGRVFRRVVQREQWDTRPGKCPWFSLVKDHPLREVSR